MIGKDKISKSQVWFVWLNCLLYNIEDGTLIYVLLYKIDLYDILSLINESSGRLKSKKCDIQILRGGGSGRPPWRKEKEEKQYRKREKEKIARFNQV
jgi:hypothetical protein